MNTRHTQKIVVLLSGGQDSTTVLYWAKKRFHEVHAVTALYGQRHVAEVDAAEKIGALAGVTSHVFVPIAKLFSGSASALIDGAAELAGSGGMADREAPKGLPTSFVPARNLVLGALAVGRAGAVGADAVALGVCQTDYSGYPDCREEFIQALRDVVIAGWPSGSQAPVIYTPLMYLTKAQTVELAKSDVVAPGCMEALALSVTCYRGQRPGCGRCPACELRARGFAEAGIPDPAVIEAG